MLGTGNAQATQCYNTCFVLEEQNHYFMVDAGGGNTILGRLREAEVDWRDVRDIFVTHKHIDHILGIVWMMRMICQNMKQGSYEGEARIYAHQEVAEILADLGETLLQKKHAAYIRMQTLSDYQNEESKSSQSKGLAGRETCLRLLIVEDGQSCEIIGHDVTFFDIHSTKAKQFGFCMYLSGHEKLTCCGDEPYNELEERYARGSKWLMHEAFCLYGQADVFKPYEKHHSTVKDAAELAASLDVENLILYHTEDKNMCRRKELYTEEGSRYFHGNLYVPEDLECFEL